MEAAALDEWLDVRRPALEAVLLHPLLTPPHGYAIGIGVWMAYLALWYSSVFAAETLEFVPFSLSVVVALGGLLVTTLLSAVAMSITAWRPRYRRIRGHALGLVVFLLAVPALFVFYFRAPPLLPRPSAAIEPLGLDVFVEHAVLTTGLLGPMIGSGFLSFALLVLVLRYRLQ